MRRGTTPTLEAELPAEIPVSDLSEAVLSIDQNGTEVIKKTLSDMTADGAANTLSVTLTQEETLKLNVLNIAEIQLKFKFAADDAVIASEPIRVPVGKILNEEVI